MIILATNNKHKVNELKDILDYQDIKSLQDLNLDIEIIENGVTFEQNSLIKAQAIAKLYPDDIIIADDSGICVDVLGGAPGVYSARFSNAKENTDYNNNLKLLKELENEENREAKFVCCICCVIPNKEPLFFRGELKGRVNTKLGTKEGFGYDPLFIVNDKLVSDMTSEEKNKISHRAIALNKLKDYLGAQCIL